MTRKRPQIYAGSDDFFEIVTKSDAFVDKSLLIKDLIDNTGEAVLVTRPRRWGKSCALDMLKKFFAMQIEKTGEVSLHNPNRVLFEGGDITLPITGKKHLSRLKIADIDEGAYMHYQGKYPVVHITLKGVVGNSVSLIEAMLRDVVREAFIQHEYLRFSKALSHTQQRDFSAYIDTNLSHSDLIVSLKKLTTYLALHHGMKVYVLIDEYDRPINYLAENGLLEENEDVIRSVAKLITAMFAECGKSNAHLEKIIFTGIFRTLHKEVNSGLNNLLVFDLNSPILSEYFGFTEKEVIELSGEILKTDQERGLKVINDWYNGYFLPTHHNATLRVFTPWAVVNYLNKVSYHGDFTGEGYWTRSGVSTIFRNLLKSGAVEQDLIDKLKLIIKGEEVVLAFNYQLSFLEQDINNKFYTESLASYLLFSTGYLTGQKTDGQYHFKIPNNEVRAEFASSIEHEISAIQSQEHAPLLSHKKLLLEMASKVGKSGDIGKLLQALLENEAQTAKLIVQESNLCQNEYFSYFHMLAIAGNQEIFSSVITRCGKHLINEKDAIQNFTPLDYAIMLKNDPIIELLEKNGALSSRVSLPSYFARLYCEDLLLLSTSLVLGSGKFLLKHAPKELSQWLIAIAASYITINIKNLKTTFDDSVCQEYSFYGSIKSDSLLGFKKYIESHSNAYAVLGSKCLEENANLISSITLPFSAENLQSDNFNITLCDKKLDSWLDNESIQNLVTNMIAVAIPLAVGLYIVPWQNMANVVGEVVMPLADAFE